ncbi:hypothetical protein B7712_00775 [Streptococcus oralis subsp. oralis]|uniref:PTS system sucrose-specific EIIBCA component n=2 Tax=Streptococcus oralis TaxID=1303 RepID=A0A1X1I7P4_STROR|nr:hypothetical protein B7723_01445 [Streptococcus oralis subsp. oralis]ORO69154.1 hypothetical protein B7713_01120 [Streptococcus oralis subsp. oralis]ORO74172.1 hypothetical protein B7712_00775 [Streptococcus oralis subsp. oralis]
MHTCIYFTIQVLENIQKYPLFITNKLHTSLVSFTIELSSQACFDKYKENQMGKFEQEAKDLLQAIGGKENVTAVTHCATRMRFVLGDEKKANVKVIESIPAVKGTFTNAGQFQVIIGNDVPIFYNDFTTISAYLGVTEPALFGVNVKYIYPFVAGMIGSALAGMLSVTFNVTAASIGIGGLPGILSIQPQYMLPFAGTMLVAIVVPMLLTFFFRKVGLFTKTEDDTALQAEFVAQEEAEFVSHEPVTLAPVEIVSPLTGQVKELSQATDPVFASGVMGQGLVIEPSQGELTSPVNGTVTVLFPTKHAIGIVSDEGVELLIHVGMDTVGLDGKGFESLVAQGDHVTIGQKLIRFDMDVIKAAGLVTETPVIITNQDAYTATITGTYPTTIQAGEALMVATRI